MNQAALPLILDTFVNVSLPKKVGYYDQDSQQWIGNDLSREELVMTRQTHHKGEDH